MKSYQYQILRYYPDVVAEEFINVGIVLYALDERKLLSRILQHPSRLGALYHGIDSKFVNRLLKNVDKWLKTKGQGLLEQLNHKEYSSIDSITQSIIPPNDSSLRFSDTRTGITMNIEKTFEELFIRFVSKFEKKCETHSKDDSKAWKEYKKVFEKYSINKRLVKPDFKIKTKFSEIEFNHAWKNGHWNFYKPISFDLASKDHVIKKAWEQVGFTQELLTSKTDFTLTYLALSPKIGDTNQLNKMLVEKLNKSEGGKSIAIVFEDKAETFAQQLSLELEEYSD